MILGMTSLPMVQCCAPLGAPSLSEDEVLEPERVFKAMADHHRVKILHRLLFAGGDAVCVCGVGPVPSDLLSAPPPEPSPASARSGAVTAAAGAEQRRTR